MNSCSIIGNLTRDPESRTTQTGKQLCRFTVAVNRVSEGTDYFSVTAWEKLAESCGKYLKKGRLVYVRGPVNAATYTAKDGTTKAALEVRAEAVQFLTAAEAKEDDEELPFK